MTKETDRELLELAAKAAGWCDFDWLAGDGYMNVYDAQGKQSAWNPLTDDGDALRLAVKLHLTVRCWAGNTCAQSGAPGTPSAYVDETNHANPCAATRRAIVRAAAEIGRAMP